ncbi:retrovirus-related pol polyprotein from transposon TNT 1-94 [Tanacetum coccineum]
MKRTIEVQSLREQHQTYLSQRHRQRSGRLLEDILVSGDGYQLTYLSQRHRQRSGRLLEDILVSWDGYQLGPSDTRDTKIAALRLKFNAFNSLEYEKVNGTFTRLKCLLNDLENNGVTIPQAEVNATFDSDSDVEEDQRTSNKFMPNLNAEYHERALLANQKKFYRRSGRGKREKGKKEKEKNEKGLIDESFDWDDESVSSDDEGSTKIRAFMAIAKDEPLFGKADARSGQWVDITMKKVHKLLSMTDGDERKHVLDYTHVDLHYVEDQRKNLVNKFNLLKQEISLHKSELSNLKNTVSINCSLQNEVIRVNLENESLKDEIIDLKKVIEKWTCSKVTLDQLLSEQVPGNIVKALGGKGRRKEKISSKEVVFTKADESSSVLAPEITSDSESECDSQEPLPPLPKLIGAAPSGTSESLISLSDLTLNMADLTLDTPVPKKTRPSVKVSPAYVIKKKTEKSPAVPKPCSDKKADSSTEQLLLTLMEEVKGLKKQIEILSGTPPSSSQPSRSKATKQKTCPSALLVDPLTKEHLEHAAVKKTLSKLKAQSPLKPSPKKAPMILKPFKSVNTLDLMTITLTTMSSTLGVKYVDCLKRFVWYLDSGCSRHMTGIKQYLHRYSKESGPKVVFGDDSLGDTEGGRYLDISYFHVFGCPVHIHNHKDHLGKFDEKADDGFFLGYSLVAKAFRVFNIRRQEMEEIVHVTFSEDDEAISQSSTEGNAINFNENKSFPDDEFLKPRSEVTQCLGNTEYFPYIPAYENTIPSESPILHVFVTSEDPFEFTEADNHPALNEPDQTESVDPFEPVNHFEPVEP